LLQGISFIPVGKDGLEIYVSRRKKWSDELIGLYHAPLIKNIVVTAEILGHTCFPHIVNKIIRVLTSTDEQWLIRGKLFVQDHPCWSCSEKDILKEWN
jgi:hypothetical protein